MARRQGDPISLGDKAPPLLEADLRGMGPWLAVEQGLKSLVRRTGMFALVSAPRKRTPNERDSEQGGRKLTRVARPRVAFGCQSLLHSDPCPASGQVSLSRMSLKSVPIFPSPFAPLPRCLSSECLERW